jgi:hypothetical protein
MTKEKTGAAMRDCTETFNESGDHTATIGFDESHGLWQILVAQRKEVARKEGTERASTGEYFSFHDKGLYRALLSDGGEIFMPMQETFFAHRFAMLRDKFGTSWIIVKERTPQRTN